MNIIFNHSKCYRPSSKNQNAPNIRIGYMAGWTINNWAKGMLMGFSSGRSNAIGQKNLT